MHRRIASVAFSFLLHAAAPAQIVAGHFETNPAPPGTTVRFTGTNNSSGVLILASLCTSLRIRQGSQTGPVVFPTAGCLMIPASYQPGETFLLFWNQRDASGAFVPPGDYWWKVQTYESGFTNLRSTWFCLTVRQPGQPTLTEVSPARIGTQAQLAIAAPLQPNAPYVTGLSLNSDNPLTVFGQQTCLSPPIAVDAVTAGIGQLDAAGNAAGLHVAIPNLPALVGFGYQVQALLLPSTGVELTNGVSLTVLP